jgi:hypothetical protein
MDMTSKLLEIGAALALALALAAAIMWLAFAKDTFEEGKCAAVCKRGYCAEGDKSWNTGKCCRASWSAPAGCTEPSEKNLG